MSGINGFIHTRREEFLEELAAFCRIPSTAGNTRALAQAAEETARALRTAGAVARIIPLSAGAPPIVFAEVGEGPRTLLVYNHYDVQPPDPVAQWATDPFSPAIAGGRFFCRGASDNKGNLMARIHAVRALREAGGGVPLRVKFLVEGEEETGSPHLPRFVREHGERLRADGCLWELSWKDPQGRPIVSCGAKGLCYVELRARGARHDLHSAWAAIAPNPAWRLVWALATLLDTEYRILIDGWLGEARALTADEERSLKGIPFDEGGFREMHGLRSFVRGLSGDALMREFLWGPTCTICGLRAGYTGEGSKTVLPAEAVAKLDFRLVPGMTPEELPRFLRRHLDARGFGDIEIHASGGLMPAVTPTGDRVVRAAAAACREESGREPVLHPVAPWSGPLHEVCGRLGIPAVAFGIGNADSRDHAPNENVAVDDYFEGIRCAAAFMSIYARM